MINAEANKRGTEIITKYCFMNCSIAVRKYFLKNLNFILFFLLHIHIFLMFLNYFNIKNN
jgi:hypothetical protein